MRSATVKLLGALLGTAVLVAAGAARADDVPAGALDRIRQDKTIHIAYRQDAPPFSYKDSLGEPAGLMVDLCKAVAEHLASQLTLSSLSVAYVVVTASDRFEAIQQHKADLLCEPTSATLSRRELVDFSIATFVDGASLMIRPDGPHDMQALAGRKIGVLADTTTEQELRDALTNAGLTAEIIPAKTHTEGLAMLDDARISAYFGDRSILLSLIKNSKEPQKLALADEYLTVERYALALPYGDEKFRLEVDRALSHIYRSGALAPMFLNAFGNNFQPAPILQTLYLISALPD
ncbi:MAG TPA: amino acid ABC transporter substrate-binding protein [Acetobacteraceae bacterium]|jgi:ABC-type amino acid transport substrate-binding protein|nr:amino acid ABC transporter substrate-binding protein [Acetobacteraceae bacterium]